MEPLTGMVSWVASRWRIGAVLACGVVLASLYKLSTETDEGRAQRAQRRREDELSRVASKISSYARDVHRRHPDGDVIVSDADLAKQLRKPQEIIANALGLLSDQKKIQRAPLVGYWKLNV